jgi:hypothetical protein
MLKAGVEAVGNALYGLKRAGEPHPDRVQWQCDKCLELLNTEQDERER